MLNAMKNDVKLHRKNWLIFFAFILCGYLIGLIMMILIIRFDSGTDTFFPMGSIFALIGLGMASLIFDGITFATNYELALSMGRTRKRLVISSLILSLVKIFAGILAVYLLAHLDKLINTVFYSTYMNEFDFIGILFKVKYILLFAMAMLTFSMLFSAVKCRFGRRGWLVLYFIMLGISLIIPRFSDYIGNHPGSAAARVSTSAIKLISSMPTAGIMALGGLIMLVILLISCFLLMRTSVEFD